LVLQLGFDPAIAFSQTGIDPNQFRDPENKLPMSALGRLIAASSRLTGRADFGLLLAGSFGPTTLGLIGQMAAEGPDVRTSLRNIVRLLHHHDEAG
jgi:hypothetical protein